MADDPAVVLADAAAADTATTPEQHAGDAATPPQPAATDDNPAPMSKKAAKKQLKMQKRLELKQQRKAARKEKQKEEKAAKRARAEALPEEERALRRQAAVDKRLAHQQEQKAAKARLEQALVDGMVVVYDLGFWDKMTDSEKSSMKQQFMYSYSINRGASRPCHMHLSGCTEALLAYLKEAISGFDHWKVSHDPRCYTERFADRMADLVYLTADAEDELTEVDPSKIYIIGAFVDRNRHKNICYEKATAQGIATARLPIQQHVQLKAATVLTVNQVTAILLKQLASADWLQTLQAVLPTRKIASTE